MGARLVSVALCVASGAIVLSWYQESAPWWLAMIATEAAVRSLSAVGEVRRYKRWDAKWQAMGEPVHAAVDAPTRVPRGPERPKRRWKLVTVAALLSVAIPAYLAAVDGGAANGAGVALVRGRSLPCLPRHRGMLRRGTKRRTATRK